MEVVFGRGVDRLTQGCGIGLFILGLGKGWAGKGVRFVTWIGFGFEVL